MDTDLMFQPLRKYAEFFGRARRKEYWLFQLLFLGIEVLGAVINKVLGGGILSLLFALPFALAMIALFVPALAVSFRRLHDTNRSAWWLLIGLIPFLGGLVLLVFTVLPGTVGPNQFGPDPKDPVLETEVFA